MRPLDYERLITEHVADAEAIMLDAQEVAGGAHVHFLHFRRDLETWFAARKRNEERARLRRATWEQHR